MTYKQDYCPQGDYFECSTTLTHEQPEIDKTYKEIPSQDLPLDPSSYDSAQESISKSDREETDAPTTKLNDSFYRRSSVRIRTYRVTKK